MMNTEADSDNSTHPLLDKAIIGLPVETIMSLSEPARMLYDTIYEYCTYAADPQYQTLHKFRKRIAALDNGRERAILIDYFNADPAIHWPGMPSQPWDYYAQPY